MPLKISSRFVSASRKISAVTFKPGDRCAYLSSSITQRDMCLLTTSIGTIWSKIRCIGLHTEAPMMVSVCVESDMDAIHRYAMCV